MITSIYSIVPFLLIIAFFFCLFGIGLLIPNYSEPINHARNRQELKELIENSFYLLIWGTSLELTGHFLKIKIQIFTWNIDMSKIISGYPTPALFENFAQQDVLIAFLAAFLVLYWIIKEIHISLFQYRIEPLAERIAKRLYPIEQITP
jgi:hypothetical protein